MKYAGVLLSIVHKCDITLGIRLVEIDLNCNAINYNNCRFYCLFCELLNLSRKKMFCVTWKINDLTLIILYKTLQDKLEYSIISMINVLSREILRRLLLK